MDSPRAIATCVSTATIDAPQKVTPVVVCGSASAIVQQKSAKEKKPVSIPRSRRSVASGPSWAWVNAARIVVMIGDGARRPETRGPRPEDAALIARTIAAAQSARTGRSQAGGAGAAAGGRRGYGTTRLATRNDENASARPAVGGMCRCFVITAKNTVPA